VALEQGAQRLPGRRIAHLLMQGMQLGEGRIAHLLMQGMQLGEGAGGQTGCFVHCNIRCP